MKELFKEKIADFRVYYIQNDIKEQLLSGMYIDGGYPTTFPCIIEVDLFNVLEDKNYIISTEASTPEGTTNTYMAKLNINSSNFTFTKENYGKVNINIPLNLVLKEPTDYLIKLELFENQKVIDNKSRYFSFE